MDLPKHISLFSSARISRFIAALGGDEKKACALYKYNIQAAQTIHPLISILEVSLRNGIDRELAKHFQDSNWLLTQRNHFANNPNLTYTNYRGNILTDHFFTRKLRRAEEKLLVRGISLTHGKLLAEMTFGFWIKFFDKGPIKILKGAPLQAFSVKPKMKLADVHSHLNAIVVLRNRIAHNEPICFDSCGNICLDIIKAYESKIMDAIGWLDCDLRIWTEKMNFFKPVYMRIASL